MSALDDSYSSLTTKFPTRRKNLYVVQVTRPPTMSGKGSVSLNMSRGRARSAVLKDTTSTAHRSTEIISAPICLWRTALKPMPLFSSWDFSTKISLRSAGSSKNFCRCCGFKKKVLQKNSRCLIIIASKARWVLTELLKSFVAALSLSFPLRFIRV